MITIRQERPVDEAAREALLDRAYGPSRHTKPSNRLRNGRLPADGLALVAIERGLMVGTVRLWEVNAGRGRPALLLGPLAVHPDHRKRGIGSALMQRALAEAARLGHGAVVLVGDAAYYGRFGFAAGTAGQLALPGAERARLLAVELVPGSLAGTSGQLTAAGRREPCRTIARLARSPRLVPRAA